MAWTGVSENKLSIFQWTADAKEHIELIRKAKFRIGVPKIREGGASDTLADSLLTDLHGACAHLSETLYQKDTHFILELIQNAEDNTYPGDERPTLMFVLGEGDPTVEVAAEVDRQNPSTINDNSRHQLTLAVYNNEVGFQSENVEALCGISKSTKKNKEFGYIGEKGIGFKSVFLVCKRPCILSGGYRFSFDEAMDSDAGIGYIVPTWLDENKATVSQLSKFHLQDAFRTAILLPLKPEKGESVQRQLCEIAPETLLFLRKLQVLVIYDLVNGSFMAFDRKPDKKTGVVELGKKTVGTETSVRYWLHQAVFDVPAQIVEEKRVGITKWTIFVAFPFCKSAETDEDAHDVFAFLPTEIRTGWPFLINADFLLVASREAILFDRPWNVGLLQCMPVAFVQGYLDLQRRARSCVLSLSSKQYDVLRFVPLRTVAKDLESVRKQMIACLRSQEVIPVSKLFEEGENAAAEGASGRSRSASGQGSGSSSSSSPPSITLARSSAAFENEGTANLGGGKRIGRGESPEANSAEEGTVWCSPKCARMADPDFVKFLWRVKNSGHPIPFWFGTKKETGGQGSSPSTHSGKRGVKWRMYLVDEDAQQRYYGQLVELGVQSMTKTCYWDCVGLGDWCENLSEALYVELLAVFANGQFLGKEDMMKNGVRLLRVDGEEKLSESTNERPIYLPPMERDDWLATCIEQLQTVAPVRLFSKPVYKTICYSSSGLSIVGMLQKCLNVKRLTVESYAFHVVQASLQLADPEKVLLVADFFRNALERYTLPVPTAITWLSMIPLLQENGSIIHRGVMRRKGYRFVPTSINCIPVLMPQSMSKWPDLLEGDTSWEGKVIKLSEAYLRNSPPLEGREKEQGSPQFHGSGGPQVSGQNPQELQDQRSKREDFIRKHLKAVDVFSLEPSGDAELQILHRSSPDGLPAKKVMILIEWLGKLLFKYGRHGHGAPDLCDLKRELKSNRLPPFWQAIHQCSWVPTSCGGRRPVEAWFPRKEITDVLGDAMPLIVRDALVLTERAMETLQRIGVKTSITSEDVYSHLLQLSQYPASQTTAKAVQRLYKFLRKEGFTVGRGLSFPVWYCARNSQANESSRWCEPSECLWEDEDGLFADSLPVLKDVYTSDLQQWFKWLGVHVRPTIDHCLQIWLDRTPPCRAREDAAYVDTNFAGKVWALIARYANEAQKSKVWAVFQRTAMLPLAAAKAGESGGGRAGVPGGREVKQTSSAAGAVGHSRLQLGEPSRLFVPDDLLLEKVFVDHDPTLPLVWLPDIADPRQLQKLFHLCKVMGASSLSEASTMKVTRKGRSLPLPLPRDLHVEIRPGHRAPEPVLGDPLFTAVLGFRYLPGVTDHFDREAYHTCVSPLVKARECLVEQMEVERILMSQHTKKGKKLPSHVRVKAVEQCTAYWDKDENILYRTLEPINDHVAGLGGITPLRRTAELAEAVSFGVLPSHPKELVKKCTEFLRNFLSARLLTMEAIEYLLMQNNIRLSMADRQFIRDAKVSPTINQKETQMDEDTGAANGDASGEEGMMGDGDVAVDALTVPLPLAAAGDSAAAHYSDASAAEPKTMQDTIIEDMEGELNPRASASTIREGEQSQSNALRRGRHSGITMSYPMERDAEPSAGFRGEKKALHTGARGKPRDKLATSRADAIMEHTTSQEESAASAPVVGESARRRRYANLEEYMTSQEGATSAPAVSRHARAAPASKGPVFSLSDDSDERVVMMPADEEGLKRNMRAALKVVNDRIGDIEGDPKQAVFFPDEHYSKLHWWVQTSQLRVRAILGLPPHDAIAESLNRALMLAFLHPSYFGTRMPSYERLEFFGDSILDACVADRLFCMHPQAHEGVLTEMKEMMVSNRVNAMCIRAAGLDEFIIMGHLEREFPPGNEARPGQSTSPWGVPMKVMADVLEAIVAVIFLWYGPSSVTKLLFHFFYPLALLSKPADGSGVAIEEVDAGPSTEADRPVLS